MGEGKRKSAEKGKNAGYKTAYGYYIQVPGKVTLNANQ
jgi:hypothetical protein